MSSRQLRKLQRQRELEQAKLQPEPEGSEEEEEEELLPAAKPSAFANFALLQQEGDQEEDEEESAAEDAVIEELQKPAPSKSKSKKKKKRKAKAKNQVETDTEPEIPKANAGPDEIDAALEALNLKPINSTDPSREAASYARRKNAEYDRSCALLSINTQHLKVANEMRSLFGRTAVGNHEDAGGAVPRAGRRAQRQNQPVDLETALKGNHAPGKGLPAITLRRNPFIQGKDEWPKGTTGGLTMEVVEDLIAEDGTIEFRFVHSELYEKVQQQFYMFVQMGDPSNLIGLLQQNPYNVSLLLQVSKIAKDQGDHALSSDLIERALFTFGRAALSAFSTKLQIGKARLDFARPENRELWLAGYHYIRSLMMKGTYRTALEWAKLLFALSPEEDHYCMNFMIHHLAVRSYQSDWLLDVFDDHIFELVSWYSSPSVALAAMQAKNTSKSKEILSKAIERFPWIFAALFKELNIDPPPSIWGSLPKLDEEKLFTEIYVRQTKDIWNTPAATSLLKEVAAAAPKQRIRQLGSHAAIEVTLDVARYVYLDGTRELMTLLPKELLYREPNSDSDPLPPSRENNIFSHASQRLQYEGPSGSGRGGLAGQANLLQAIADLLPQFLRRSDRNQDDEEIPGDLEDSEDDDSEAERRFDVARLVVALEDLEGGGEEMREMFDQMPGAFPAAGGDEAPRNGENGASDNRAAAYLFGMMERMFTRRVFDEPVEDEDEEEDTDDEMPELI